MDVVLKAFNACAASQGCTKYARCFFVIYNRLMLAFSNLTFGTGGKEKDGSFTTGWGYYEV